MANKFSSSKHRREREINLWSQVDMATPMTATAASAAKEREEEMCGYRSRWKIRICQQIDTFAYIYTHILLLTAQ